MKGPLLPPSTLIRGFRHNGVIYNDITGVSEESAKTIIRHGGDVWNVNTKLLTGEFASIKFLARQMKVKPVRVTSIQP